MPVGAPFLRTETKTIRSRLIDLREAVLPILSNRLVARLRTDSVAHGRNRLTILHSSWPPATKDTKAE